MKERYLDQRIGRIIKSGNQEFLYFSGTSYLGMEQILEYEDILIQNIRRYGFNHGLSRVNNVRLSVFEEFEVFFAKNAGAESAAVVSSGYLAGISAWQFLYPQADTCWIAPDTHPAILPADLKPDYRLSFTDWKNQCLEYAGNISSRKILLLGNAVDPLRAAIHDYAWVRTIAQKHEVTLLVDDSHAFGVLGRSVFGTYSAHLDPQINLVVSGSLGKGLAMPAGIVLGKKEVIEGIKSQPIFTGASPGSPANLHTFLDMQDIYSAQSQKIRDYSGIFFQETQDLSTVVGSSNFPVFIYPNPEWPEILEQRGFITSSFPYPTADSQRINRIVISGFHSLTDLMSLTDTLHQLSKQ